MKAHVPLNTPWTGGVNWVNAAYTNTSTHPIKVLLNPPIGASCSLVPLSVWQDRIWKQRQKDCHKNAVLSRLFLSNRSFLFLCFTIYMLTKTFNLHATL